jgi:transcriptional regulator with XRE-family HTH domain
LKLKLNNNLSLSILKALFMKQTEEDRRFAGRFAYALQPYIAREQDKGRSLAEIARELGVTGPGLQKQLAGGTPSIRTIALAHAIYKISVPYGGIEFTKSLSAKRKYKETQERQLHLPFEITAPTIAKEVGVKLVSNGIRKYRLHLTVKIAG